MGSPSSSSPPSHRLRLLAWIAGGILALLVLAGFAAGPVAQHVINGKLAAMQDYQGRIGDVSISVWRGRAVLEDAVLQLRSTPDAPPLARVGRLEANLAWAQLLRGKLSAELLLRGAEIHVTPRTVKQEKPAAAQEVLPKIARWQDELRHAFPVEITRLECIDTRVRFLEPNRQPPIDIGLDRLHLVATGLTNRPSEDVAQPARATLDAVTTGDGRLHVVVTAAPMNAQPTFHAQLQLRGLGLPALNPFLLAYANADVSAGTFDFDAEIDAASGHYEGYVKPFFHDLDFQTPSDKNKNVVQRLAEKVVSAAASVLENDEDQKVATKAPFSGDFKDNDVDIWTTIVNLLRNAFVQGIREGFEGQQPTK